MSLNIDNISLNCRYRENAVTHQSVLSSLSASYNGACDFSYYEDLPKVIETNLGEIDVDHFRTDEDINLLLNSICKSKQLFSPVKESVLSIDSLDVDAEEDCDMILTCQANKNNYTIAFEGSTFYTDDSYYGKCGIYYRLGSTLHSNLTRKILLLPVDNSMGLDQKMWHENQMSDKSGSDSRNSNKDGSVNHAETGFTTWRDLRKNSSSQLHRYPSGNNNTSLNFGTQNCHVRKSSSLPNLLQHTTKNIPGEDISKSMAMTRGKMYTILPRYMEAISSASNLTSQNLNSNQQSSQAPFNLVKLFIKQKTYSADTCMDVSSGCWPSEISLLADQKNRKKSMHDSGKGSALSKHEEATNDAEIQYDSLDLPPVVAFEPENNDNPRRTIDIHHEANDPPILRTHMDASVSSPKQLEANINNNNSIERENLKSTKSSSETSRTSDKITQVLGKSKIPLSLITRSMQTSVLKQSVKVIPPSFLAQLNQNMRCNMQKQAPVYVIYPNYVLPDLGFVKNYQSQIVLSPLELKDTPRQKRRPMSTADIERLKDKQYEHVVDWKSLLTLLPSECKSMLTHVPEVRKFYNEAQILQKPLFCENSTISPGPGTLCDCSHYYTSPQGGSGTSQQLSSGYAGSSATLADVGLSDKLIDTNDLPPLPKYDIMKRRSNLAKSKRNSMPEDYNSFKYKIEKRNSVQHYSTIPKINSDNNRPEHCPVQGKVINKRLNLKQFQVQLPERTKESAAMKQRMEYDDETRSRVEIFLSNVPRSELKYYAEIANVLESIENISSPYDRNELKNQVSCTLVQKHISFDTTGISKDYFSGINDRPFTTPPNSPNISITTARRNLEQVEQNSTKWKQNKIQNHRFKRLQIQWELLSKEASQMEDELTTRSRSGGSTPLSAPSRVKSRIPRPVSYPAASK